MSSRDKIVDRITKLKLKAADSGVTPEEAASFADKASRMMAEHMVTEDEVSRAEGREKGVDGYAYHVSNLNVGSATLMTAIGMMFGVGCVHRPDYAGDQVALVGRKLNCDAAYEVYQRIVTDIWDQAERFYVIHKQKDDYVRGLMFGVASKCMQIRQKDADSRLPMVLEMEKVEEFMTANGVQQEAVTIEPKSFDEFRGMLDADVIEINKSVDK